MKRKGNNSDYWGGTQRIQKRIPLIKEIRDNLTINNNNFSALKDINYV